MGQRRGRGSQVYFQLLEGPFKLPGVWDRSSLGGCIHWKSPHGGVGKVAQMPWDLPMALVYRENVNGKCFASEHWEGPEPKRVP